MLKIVENNESQSENRTNLDALARAGAQQMLQAALEVEVAEYLGRHANERDEAGPRQSRSKWARTCAQGHVRRRNTRSQAPPRQRQAER